MNRRKNVIAALLLSLVLAAGTVLPTVWVRADSESIPYLAMGKDLTQEERKTVFSLLNVDEANLDDYNVLYVTNEDEHDYLDSYISSSVIGTRALSCVLIQKRTKGYGLKVTTHNITYCTPSMYVNALSTAGITDSRVVVAGPFPISGTAALVGAMKAYEDMTGEEISEESQDAAMNELVVEGSLGEVFSEDDFDDEYGVEEFIRDLKIVVSEREFNEETEREELEALIREEATKRNLELSEEILNQLIDLMDKINNLNLDTEQLEQQTEVITEEPAAASTEAAGKTPAATNQDQTAEPETADQNQAAKPETAGKEQAAKPETAGKEQAAEPEAAGKEQTEEPEAAGKEQAEEPGTDSQDQITARGQEQIDAFNAFFQNEEKTLGLITSIQDDMMNEQSANGDGTALSEDQKREIVKNAFIRSGIIPHDESGGDLSSYDDQIDKTILVIDNIDLFNLDLDGYRQRTTAADAQEEESSQETAASEEESTDSQTQESIGEEGAGEEGTGAEETGE